MMLNYREISVVMSSEGPIAKHTFPRIFGLIAMQCNAERLVGCHTSKHTLCVNECTHAWVQSGQIYIYKKIFGFPISQFECIFPVLNCRWDPTSKCMTYLFTEFEHNMVSNWELGMSGWEKGAMNGRANKWMSWRQGRGEEWENGMTWIANERSEEWSPPKNWFLTWIIFDLGSFHTESLLHLSLTYICSIYLEYLKEHSWKCNSGNIFICRMCASETPQQVCALYIHADILKQSSKNLIIAFHKT